MKADDGTVPAGTGDDVDKNSPAAFGERMEGAAARPH